MARSLEPGMCSITSPDLLIDLAFDEIRMRVPDVGQALVEVEAFRWFLTSIALLRRAAGGEGAPQALGVELACASARTPGELRNRLSCSARICAMVTESALGPSSWKRVRDTSVAAADHLPSSRLPLCQCPVASSAVQLADATNVAISTAVRISTVTIDHR